MDKTLVPKQKSGLTISLDFSAFLKDVQKTFLKNVERYGNAIYHTYNGSLKKSPYNQIYLDGFESPVFRQEHSCACCRHWLQKYADLVFIDSEGKTISAFWNPDDITIPEYVGPVWRMKEKAETSLVTSAWVGGQDTIGIEEAGGFNHFYFDIPRFFTGRVGKVSESGTGKAMNELAADYHCLKRALEEYSMPVLELAAAVTNAPGVFENPAALGKRSQFLLEVAQKANSIKHFFHRQNYILLRATTAPAGWARPTNNILGEFLDHLRIAVENAQDGEVNIQQAIQSVNKLLDPLRYRRTQEEAVRKGQIDRAEKIMKELGFNEPLSFTMAKLSDIPVKIWEPRLDKEKEDVSTETFSMFDTLRKNVEEKERPTITTSAAAGEMTFVRFMEVVLPRTLSMKVLTAAGRMNIRYYFKMVNENTPGIWAHDTVDEDRLPIASFLYAEGSLPEEISLPRHAWVDVVAIIPHQSQMKPGRVYNPMELYTLVLKDAVAVTLPNVPLFPSELRRELREVDNVIEALGKGLPLSECGEGAVIGLDIVKGLKAPAIYVEVFDGVVRTKYKIDRYE